MADELPTYQEVQERRRQEAKERSMNRSIGEAFGEAALGGRTLSEALRSRAAQTSTKERRRIKEAYRRAKESANLTGENDSFKSGGIDDSNDVGMSDNRGASLGTSTDGFSEESLTVVINGSAVTKTFLTK